ncbi:MAG TPA: DUF1028 domain-containing protein [Actinomycetota bacterium]|nr:DUF1028 domain-containing protein [Actinomycetota bacterium]
MTFSIVAWDPQAPSGPEWGVAVASKFLAVGAVVGWARAGAGALATQAFANVAYGPEGLDRLESGEDAEAVLRRLTEADEDRAHRQLGVVDALGRSATYTGAECFDWAGGRSGDGYCCQGNILVGREVVDAMCDAFESTGGDLAPRLIATLQAGDRAGGDRRGRQSASLLVVREGGAYGGGLDKAVDLRVDDHADPVPELTRLWELHNLLFPRKEDLEFVVVNDQLRAELTERLHALGHEGDLHTALFSWAGVENLEERLSDDDSVIERKVLELLRDSRRD